MWRSANHEGESSAAMGFLNCCTRQPNLTLYLDTKMIFKNTDTFYPQLIILVNLPDSHEAASIQSFDPAYISTKDFTELLQRNSGDGDP